MCQSNHCLNKISHLAQFGFYLLVNLSYNCDKYFNKRHENSTGYEIQLYSDVVEKIGYHLDT